MTKLLAKMAFYVRPNCAVNPFHTLFSILSRELNKRRWSRLVLSFVVTYSGIWLEHSVGMIAQSDGRPRSVRWKISPTEMSVSVLLLLKSPNRSSQDWSIIMTARILSFTCSSVNDVYSSAFTLKRRPMLPPISSNFWTRVSSPARKV